MAVQYRVLEEGAYAAYYRLTDPRGQIQSYVFDVVRSTVPKMELDEAFASKDEIASAVLEQLKDVMKDYGYEILNTLVTDMAPDRKVKASMNEINASKRLKEAAAHKAEADKIKLTKAAEAEAESRYLSGLGVARQRKAIVQGLQESVTEFSNEVGTRPKVRLFYVFCLQRHAIYFLFVTDSDMKIWFAQDVMDILLLSQYFDTLSTVGANSLFVNHDPSTVAFLQESIGGSFVEKKMPP